MWEQSKYFEDFENAANYVNGRFDPKQAQVMREKQGKERQQQQSASTDVRTIAQQHRPRSKSGK
jgi:hypothetical protein